MKYIVWIGWAAYGFFLSYFGWNLLTYKFWVMVAILVFIVIMEKLRD